MSQGRGKNILITGASGGIGMATALYLADKGYSVIGAGRSVARLARLREQASERGLPITTVELDINSDEGVAHAMPGLIERHGSIDMLVNNAGYSLWGPSQSLSMLEIKDVFETNFFAAFRVIQAVLPGMVERGSGDIEALRFELWPLGIRVTVVEPGLFSTNLLANQVMAARAESPDLPYGPYIKRYRARRSGYDRLSKDPIKVARVVHKILRSRHPRFRYTVGAEAALGMLGARFLPERVFQTLLARALVR